MRCSQERKGCSHGVLRAYAVVRIQRGNQNIHDKRVIFDYQNMERSAIHPSKFALARSDRDRRRSIWTANLRRSVSTMPTLAAAFRAAAIAASTLGSVPDDSMTSEHDLSSSARCSTTYRAQLSNLRTMSFRPGNSADR